MKKLSDRIWETRKIRIYSEKRLLFEGTFSEILIAWYSFLLVATTIISLVHKIQNIEIFTLIGSIAVLTTSLFLFGQIRHF